MSIGFLHVLPAVGEVQIGGRVPIVIQTAGNIAEADGAPIIWSRLDGCHVDADGTLIDDVINGTPQYSLAGAGGPDIGVGNGIHDFEFICHLPLGVANCQINAGFSNWPLTAQIWGLGQLNLAWTINPTRASVHEFPIGGGGGERTALIPGTNPPGWQPHGKRFKIHTEDGSITWSFENNAGVMQFLYSSNLLEAFPYRAAAIFFQHNGTGKFGGAVSSSVTMQAFRANGTEVTPPPFLFGQPDGDIVFVAPTGITAGGAYKIRATSANNIVGEATIIVGLPGSEGRMIISPAQSRVQPDTDVPLQVSFAGALANINGQVARWANLVNCTVDDMGTLHDTAPASPDGWGIAGATCADDQRFFSGDGYFEFQWNVDPNTTRPHPGAGNQARTGGLTDRAPINTFVDIIYCINVANTGVGVYIFGSLVHSLGRGPLYGEVYRVAYEGGQVVFRVQGQEFYRANFTLYYPARGAVAFFYHGATNDNKFGGIVGPTYELRAYKSDGSQFGGILVTPPPFTGNVFNAPSAVGEVGTYIIDAVTPNEGQLGDHYINTSKIIVELIAGPAFVTVESANDRYLPGEAVQLTASTGGFLCHVNGAIATFQNLTAAVVNADGALVDTSTPGPPAWGISGARTVQQITAGDGFIEFFGNIPPGIVQERTGGLTNVVTVTSYVHIKFCIHVTPGGVQIIEDGVLKFVARAGSAMDQYRVAYENGQVVYRINGEVVYRSDIAPVYPVWGGTAFSFHDAFSRFGGIPGAVTEWRAYREDGTLITPTPFTGQTFTVPLSSSQRYKLEALTANFASGFKNINAQFPFGYDNFWNLTYPCGTFIDLWGEGTFKVNELINDDQSALYHIPTTNAIRRWRITWEALPEGLAKRLDQFYQDHFGRGKPFFFWDYRLSQYFDNARITAYEVGHRKRWARRRVIEITHRPR